MIRRGGRSKPIVALLVAAILLSVTCRTEAQALQPVTVTLLDASNRPIAGVQIAAQNSTGDVRVATTDARGVATLRLPADTYTITASLSGFAVATISGVTVQQDQSLSVALRANGVPTPPPTPTPKPTTAPTPAATGIPTAPPAVTNSLLAMFNDAHPEHVSGQPYYGRYSYVLLRDGDDAVHKRNRAFVTLLVDRYASMNSVIGVGGPTPGPQENPWSENIFFFPVVGGVRAFKLPSDKRDAVNALLAAYAFPRANAVRGAYCAVPEHANTSLCALPLDDGPVVLTFLAPLPRNLAPNAFPPAFAADFSAIIPEQYGDTVKLIQQKISVIAPIKNDTVVEAPFSARIAAALDNVRVALAASFPALKVFLDKGLGAK
jgi:hypothetical protein